jgi:DNA-directed RNA polymerase alpha subunit
MGKISDDTTLKSLKSIFGFNGTRIINCLQWDGILTVGQVRAMSDNELRRRPNFGPISLKILREVTGPGNNGEEI